MTPREKPLLCDAVTYRPAHGAASQSRATSVDISGPVGTRPHDLTQACDTANYVIGICRPSWANSDESVGCHNDPTSLADFTSAQLHDRVSASTDGTTLTFRSVNGSWTFESE